MTVRVNRRLTGAHPSCAARGGEALAGALEALAAEHGLAIEVVRNRCFGRCERGPNARVAPGGAFFERVTDEDLDAIVERAMAAPGRPGDG